VVDNGVTAQTACFDIADRLVNYTEGVVTTTPVYDYRGRVTGMGGESFVYDQADRHVSTTGSGVTVTYTRDATGSIVARSENGSAVRYSGGAVLSAANVVLERSVSLPGGVMVTKLVAGDVWSYPNVHGDIVAVCDGAGVKQGPTFVYDPYGNTASLPDNSYGTFDFGWVGQHSKHTDHATGLGTVIEMGARVYHPGLGRFLSVDPIEGGTTTSDYGYVPDPNNMFDLDGRGKPAVCNGVTKASPMEARKRCINAMASGAGSWVGQLGPSVSGCFVVCLDLGYSSTSGFYAAPGIGVAFATPSVSFGAAPKCGRQEVKALDGVRLGPGFLQLANTNLPIS